MTWGECKLIALQTMFSNEGAALAEDDSNQDYIYAMPGKANEALLQITNDAVGRPLLKKFTIAVTEGAAEEAGADKLTIPACDGWISVNMGVYCPLWKKVNGQDIYVQSAGGRPELAEDWEVQGESELLLPGSAAVYTVWYQAYPEKVTGATEDSADLGLSADAAALVPLYIAAELYKEDELAMATMFRNEFEDGLEKMHANWMSRPGAHKSGTVRNTTGWW